MSLSRIFGSEAEPTPAVVNADIDEATHVLSVSRRRAVIRHVSSANRVLNLRELAREIAGEELGKEITDLTSKEYKRVYVQLYQSHLDEMDERGIIDWDKDRKTIRAGEKIDGYQTLLRAIEARTGGATA